MRAVSVVLLNAYSKGAKRALTAFLVCEKGDEGAPMWTCPMGGRKFEPVAAQAAAELDEELHLQVAPARLRDAAHFACERVPFHGGAVQHAVFVARRVGEAACAGFSRQRFLEARRACAAQGKPHQYFETTAMAHVSVARLLEAPVLATGRVLDVDGAQLELRKEFRSLLAHAGVRSRLSEALATYSEAAAAPRTLPPPPLPQPQPQPQPQPAAAVAVAAPKYKHMTLVASDPATGFRLFVGDLASANDDAAQSAAKISHVVNCCVADLAEEPATWAPFVAKRKYSFVFSDDSVPASKLKTQNPSAQWPGALRFLRECHTQGGAALVHCAYGKNRSVTTAALHLVASGLAPSLAGAVAQIRAARPTADPFPAYLAFAEGFLASVAAGGVQGLSVVSAAGAGAGAGAGAVAVAAAASAKALAVYGLAKSHDFGAMLAALAAAPPALREELRRFRSSTSGWTLLHQAARGASMEAAVALVDKLGVDTRVVAADGRSAADVAQAAGAHELATWLRVRAATAGA